MSKTWAAVFANSVRARDGRMKRRLRYNPNLRTTIGIDWQAGVMGGGPSATGAQMSGTATATSGTSLTATGTPFPAAGGYTGLTTSPLAGKIVVALTTGVWGVILSHTTSVLTIDRWNNPATPGGAAGTTPSATTGYIVLPGGQGCWWMALTADSAAAAVGDTTLTAELTTNGFARALGGWTHTNGTNTFTVNNLFTSTQASGSTTINKEAVFNAQNGGLMPFESIEPNPPPLVLNDTLSQAVIVTY